MTKWFLIAAGGALGAVSRFALTTFSHRVLGAGFPYGTLGANAIGSLAIGLVCGFFGGQVPVLWRHLVIAGFLGGFTTFSAYAMETVNLFRDSQSKLAFVNILVNNVLGISLAVAGYWLSRSLRAG